MKQEYLYIKKILNKISNKLRLFIILEGFFYSLILVLAFLIVFSIADYLINLPYLIRYVLFILFFICLALVLSLFVIHPAFKAITEEDAALIVQKKHKILKDDIINAVQLSKAYLSDKVKGVSKEIIEEFVIKANQKFKKVDVSKVINTINLKRNMLLSLCSAVILLLMVFVPPYIARNSLNRLFNLITDEEAGQSALMQKSMPEIGDIKVKVFYPKYTGMEPKVFEEGGNAEALKNSTIIISGTSNKPIIRSCLKIAREDKRTEDLNMHIKSGFNPEIKLVAKEDFEYFIEVEDRIGE